MDETRADIQFLLKVFPALKGSSASPVMDLLFIRIISLYFNESSLEENSLLVGIYPSRICFFMAGSTVMLTHDNKQYHNARLTRVNKSSGKFLPFSLKSRTFMQIRGQSVRKGRHVFSWVQLVPLSICRRFQCMTLQEAPWAASSW